MKRCLLALCLTLFVTIADGQLIVSDQYNVANSGSGFGLGSGVNSGINPPVTRLTGSQAANLRYIQIAGSTRGAALHYLTNSDQMVVAPGANSDTLSLSSGSGAYDFGPALNTAAETPGTPGVYNLTVNMANATASGNYRCSFAFSSTSGNAAAWDFGIQLYHANAGDAGYTLQKRIRKVAGGTATDLNTVVGTVGMYPNEVVFLIRVTDTGGESGANYHSQVQVSVDGGSTWIYDTATDMDLPNGGIQFSGLGRYLAWDIAPNAGPVTYDNFSLILNSTGVTNPPPTNDVVVLQDSYNVVGSGSGFVLGSGANSGINPPITRLTGSAAAGLFYIKAYGTKPDSCHYITNDTKLAVALSSVDYSTLSLSSEAGEYDFGQALEVSAATPEQPLIYDLTINMANATAAANQRCSFAISSTAGTANIWDFGIQIYRASAEDNSYVLQKRISTDAGGLQNAINASIGTIGTYPGEVPFLLRITDAGTESESFNSRLQISVDGGTNWIYDTATDPALPNGWHFSGLSRYLFFDIAPGTGPVTYDNLSLVSHGLTYITPPTNAPLAFTSYQLTTNGLELTWVSQKNTNYSVLMSTNLSSSSWTLITNITAVSPATTIAHPMGTPTAFYRVAELTNSGISVDNVVAAQRSGTGLVDIYYDLADLYGGDASVSVLVSTNGGQTYNIAAAGFSGDAGADISSGAAKHIVWNAGADLAGISASDLRVEIVTDRSPVGSNMALVPDGVFEMGNSESLDGIACELPVHTVSVDAFYADRYEVTKGLWDTVSEWATNHGYSFDSPAVAPGPDFPVQQISWYDAVKWCNARSEMEGLPPAYFVDAAWTQAYRTGQVDLVQTCVRWAGAGYRLPTEAEWEKAARGGLSGKRFPWGDTINESQANYWSTLFENYDVNGTSGPNLACPLFPNTMPVGSFPPTGYGLYDMAGNTWVWCWDYYGDTWYADALASRANTRGPASASWGGDRVYRGGSGVDNSWKCRVANRADAPPRFAMGHFGFRVVLPAGNNLSAASSPVFSLNF